MLCWCGCFVSRLPTEPFRPGPEAAAEMIGAGLEETSGGVGRGEAASTGASSVVAEVLAPRLEMLDGSSGSGSEPAATALEEEGKDIVPTADDVEVEV